MTVFWVQQWITLPIIVEDQIGDTGDAGRLPQDSLRREFLEDSSQIFSAGYRDLSSSFKAPRISQDLRPQADNPAFLSQYSSIPPMSQAPQDLRPGSQQGAASFNVNPRHDFSFNMGSMAEALPDYHGGHSNQGMQQRPLQPGQQPLPGASTSTLVYQPQQISQYPGQAGPAYPGLMGVNTGYATSNYPNMYSQRSAGPSPTQQSYAQISPQSQSYYYYPNQYGQSTPSPQYAAHHGQMSSPYDRSFSASQTPGLGQQHPYALQQSMRVGLPTGTAGIGAQVGALGSIGTLVFASVHCLC